MQLHDRAIMHHAGRHGSSMLLPCLAGVVTLALCLLVQYNPAPVVQQSPTRIALTAPRMKPAGLMRGHVPSIILNRLPLRFELNEGQAADEVRFLAHGAGYTLFLTDRVAVLAFASLRFAAHLPSQGATRPSMGLQAGEESLLRLSLSGANEHPGVVGVGRLPGTTNYLSGNDSRRWRRDVPSYARVEYRNVYPGVSLVFYSRAGALEYDLVVAPGIHPGIIRLAISGTGGQKPRLDRQGNLVLRAGDVLLRQERPLIYQEINGIRHMIAGEYVPVGGHEVGIAVARYNAAWPLVIDPVLSYATYVGGNDLDASAAIAVDGSGSAYVTGYSASTDFPTTGVPGAVRGDADAFVAKLAPNGTTLVYSTYFGGSGTDQGSGVAVDSTGAAYVTGWTSSSDFSTVAPIQAYSGGEDAFVAKLNPVGDSLIYSTYLGGSDRDAGAAIAVDSTGAAYITGVTTSADFTTTARAVQTKIGGVGEADAFIAKIDPMGKVLTYSTYLGGSGDDQGSGVAVDSTGAAYVTGWTDSPDFPTTATAFQPLSGGQDDAFVIKLTPDGTVPVYSTRLGGSGSEAGTGIAVDSTGAAYVTGWTDSADFLVRGQMEGTYSSGGDAFVVMLNPGGSSVAYGFYFGGSGADQGSGIALDAGGNAYIAGTTESADFRTVTPLRGSCDCTDSTDAFVAKISSMTLSTFRTTTIYFAEGYTGRLSTNRRANFDEYISVLNPEAVTRKITFTYLLQGRSTPVVKTMIVGPNRVAQRFVNHDVGSDQDVSAIVTADGPIAAERVINRTTPSGRLDSTSSNGVSSTSTTWYFAEGYTGLTFQEYLTVLNPGSVPARVTVTFLPQDVPATTPRTVSFLVPPHRRWTENIYADYLPYSDKSVGMIVRSDQPIVVERPMYWGAGDGSTKFGADSAPGFTDTGEPYYFAYGSQTGMDPANVTSPVQRPGDQAFLTIANPNPAGTTDATVRISFASANGRAIGSVSLKVLPQTRRTVKVSKVVSQVKGPFSTIVTSDQRIVVESPQYVGGSPNSGPSPGFSLPAAQPAQSAASLAFVYTHPAGGVADAWSEHIFLLNTGATESKVTGIFYGSGDGVTSKSYEIPAGRIVAVDVDRDARSLGDDVWAARFTSNTGHLVGASIGRSANHAAYIGDTSVVTGVP